MKKLVGKVLKIIGGCLVGFIILTLAIGLLYQGDDNKPATSNQTTVQKPTETETDETKEEEEQSETVTTEPESKEPEKEETKSSEVDKALEWLTSIGAFDELSQDWGSDEEVLDLYNSIQKDLKTWNVSFDDMRTYVEDFDPNLTLDEIAELTDYQIYIDYKNLNTESNVDAEEADWEEDYTYVASSVQEFKDFIREDYNIGNRIIFKGVVLSSNTGVYKYAINIDSGLYVYISDPGFNLINDDIVEITAIYCGKNDMGQICFDTVSVEIQ